MQCYICQRSPSSRLEFNCSNCARSALYQPRIQHAELLLDVESLGQEVERTTGGVQPPKAAQNSTGQHAGTHPSFAIQQTTAERLTLTDQTEKIIAQAEILRRQVEDTKAYLGRRREHNTRRRSGLQAARSKLAQRQASDVEPLEKNITRVQSYWDALHARTAESRTFLCKEAAQLYGLQQRRRKKGVPGRDLYLIGGLPISDLRDLNNASPTQVTASITNLAHIVHLASHYLSLRLPAEITLPHRDYPLPTIFSPGSSYNARETPYPGFTPTHSSNNSPSASKTADAGSPPRPRPLHIEKKLAALAKEEPIAYASFVEGITLLAWDVAWMCKTQGLDVGKSSWEEVCAVGRNLWQLLLSPPSTSRKQVPPPLYKDILNNSNLPPQSKDNDSKPSTTMMGHFSHGTAHSFLSAAEGLDYMTGWRLQSPLKVIERVKAMLQSERDGAEWQLLEENEWEEAEALIDPTGIDVGVAAGTRTEEGSQQDSAGGGDEAVDWGRGEGMGKGRGKGTSGWTKLKSREA